MTTLDLAALKRAAEAATPKIVCLCGSTRFKDAFVQANLRETLAGKMVLTIGCDMRTDDELFGAMSPDELQRTKDELDRLHLWKIWRANEVLILNVGGYIGASTTRELWFARELRRTIRYLEPDNIAGVLDKVSTFAAKMHSDNPDSLALALISRAERADALEAERDAAQQRAEVADVLEKRACDHCIPYTETDDERCAICNHPKAEHWDYMRAEEAERTASLYFREGKRVETELNIAQARASDLSTTVANWASEARQLKAERDRLTAQVSAMTEAAKAYVDAEVAIRNLEDELARNADEFTDDQLQPFRDEHDRLFALTEETFERLRAALAAQEREAKG